ncbi:MAG TPA: glycosyl hydrolase [Solirubrobacteraceae bacterium]|nr:glycosyl hydrolase [Solirubrobacteraceae bacterium]
MKTLATSILLVTAALGLLAYQEGIIGHSSSPAVVRASPAPRGPLELGVTTGPLAQNWWRPWKQADLSTVRTFESEAGKPAAIVMWYADWQHNGLPLVSQLNDIARRGSVPEITWEPWDASKGLYSSQPRYRLSNIIAGKFDAYIAAWARTLATWKRPVYLRFAQESDGNWFPWADYANGNQPGEFIAAWQHVHRIFEQAGAVNVKWVWSPAFASTEVFPGTGYVNVVATTCQNGGRKLFARGWQSFAQGCGKTIGRLHALAPGLPIQLAETSSAETGGSKAQWIEQMFAYLAVHPEVTSAIWFNLVKETNWRIDSSPSAERAFAAGARAAWVT